MHPFRHPLAPQGASQISGLILAGGEGRRMGHLDKGLIDWHGRPLVQHVRDGMAAQVAEIWISANRNAMRYAAYGSVVADDPAVGCFQGPLAGLASVMPMVTTPWILTWACDMPRVPVDLARRMAQCVSRHGAPLGVAVAQGRMQPVCMLVATTLLPSLRDYLAGGGRRVDAWQQSAGAVCARFDDQPWAFFNFNTPDDLRTAPEIPRP